MPIKWKKKGDFSVTYDSPIYYHRTVTYISGKASVSQHVHIVNIYGFQDNSITIDALGSPALHKKCLEAGFAQPHVAQLMTEVGKTTDKGLLKKYLDILDAFDPLEEIKDEIYISLGIKKPIMHVWTEIAFLIENKKLSEAFKQIETASKEYDVKNYGMLISHLNEKISTTLAQLNTIQLNEVLNFYLSFPKNTPHYDEANRLIYNFLSLLKMEKVEDTMEWLEIRFRFALRCGPDDTHDYSYDSALIFHALCENTGPISAEELKSINTDNADFLITLAKKIRTLRDENEGLKSELAKIRAADAAHSRMRLWKKENETNDAQNSNDMTVINPPSPFLKTSL